MSCRSRKFETFCFLFLQSIFIHYLCLVITFIFSFMDANVNISRFIAFLKDHDAYTAFLDELSLSDSSFPDSLYCFPCELWLELFFRWADSINGFNYWKSLDNEWHDYLSQVSFQEDGRFPEDGSVVLCSVEESCKYQVLKWEDDHWWQYSASSMDWVLAEFHVTSWVPIA